MIGQLGIKGAGKRLSKMETPNGPYGDQTIEAAFLHTKLEFYFIGPFSRRVSFASQQCRAIDLVNALNARKKLISAKGSYNVAVIGGGIAGLTAAALLRGHGCCVDIFEREERILNLQESAKHRVVHPMIARWPGTRPLQYSTDFGLLDWCAGPGNEVLTTMLREWVWQNGFLTSDGKSDREFTKAGISELIHQEDAPFSAASMVGLRTVAEDGNPARRADHQNYDFVIVATGFGKEAAPEGLEEYLVPYWTNDHVDDWRKKKRRVAVSGCGDGGLIDCLRLIHGYFHDGWLAVRLAQVLERNLPGKEGELLLDGIEQAEHKAALFAKSIECMGIAVRERGKSESGEFDPIYGWLRDFYFDFVKEKMPSEAQKLLDRSIEAAGIENGKISLWDGKASPFTHRSAPIHKIMLAHAMVKNKVIFHRGSLSSEKVRPARRGRPPVYKPVFITATGKKSLGRDEELIIRHGSIDPFRDIDIGDGAVKSLGLRQMMLADFLDLKKAGPNPWPSRWAPRDDRMSAYRELKRLSVAALMDVILPGCSVGHDADGFNYIQATAPADADAAPETLERPTSLFGIAVKEKPESETDAL